MMLMTVELNGLVFHPVEAQTVILGSTKGGWMYAGQRPCHEANFRRFSSWLNRSTNVKWRVQWVSR